MIHEGVHVFLAKKIISAALLPPGCFIVVLLGTGVWTLCRRRSPCGLVALSLGLILWALSLGPVANYLTKGLVSGLTMPARLNGDVIVLLGGGVNDDARDLTGNGAPSDELMSRLVTAVRLQKMTDVPVIVSGGSMLATDTPEATIMKRFLQDLGVPGSRILIEDRSRDTGENARYVAEICRRHGFRRPLLVTSAYHMKRAQLIFERNGMPVIPLPSGLSDDRQHEITPYTFLPRISSLVQTVSALHERLGLLFYRMTLPVQGKRQVRVSWFSVACYTLR